MLPSERTDREYQKFIETQDGRVAVGFILSEDSYTIFDSRYVKIDTGITVQDSTETSNAAIQLNALLARLREAKLISLTT
jgi:hypothetical protein